MLLYRRWQTFHFFVKNFKSIYSGAIVTLTESTDHLTLSKDYSWVSSTSNYECLGISSHPPTYMIQQLNALPTLQLPVANFSLFVSFFKASTQEP
jgi:hypothetical protein